VYRFVIFRKIVFIHSTTLPKRISLVVFIEIMLIVKLSGEKVSILKCLIIFFNVKYFKSFYKDLYRYTY